MYSKENLNKLPKIGRLAPEGMTAFHAYDKAALADGAIPKKYKELMAIAVALTTQCPLLHRSASAGGPEDRCNRAGTSRSCPGRRRSSCRRCYRPWHSSFRSLTRPPEGSTNWADSVPHASLTA